MDRFAHGATRRDWLALAGAMACSAPARAQQPKRKFAVLSLIGNELQIVYRSVPTGTNLVKPQVQSVQVSGGTFDRHALTVAERVLLPLSPGDQEVVLLTSTSPSLHTQQGRFFEGPQLGLPAVFVKAAKDDHATHLVLLTRHRGQAQMRLLSSWVGEGWIEGLGYYVDRVEVIKDLDNRDLRTGFISPYVWVRASLIELASMRIVREETILGHRVILQTVGDGSIDPWGALSGAEKVTMLNELISGELERVLPALVGPR